MTIIATAMTTAVRESNSNDPDRLAVALLVQGIHESHYAAHVHAGECLRWECDPMALRDPKEPRRLLRDASGQVMIMHRAVNVWQTQGMNSDRKLWRVSKGADLESTTNAARLMVRYLKRHHCKGNIVHMYQAMDGKRCRNGARGFKRAAHVDRLMPIYLASIKE